MSSLSTQDSRMKRRQLDKKLFGDDIAMKLNGATPSARVLRVKSLIQLLQATFEKTEEIDSICRERQFEPEMNASWIFSRKPLLDYDLNDPTVSELAKQIMKNADEVNLLLRRYSWRPGVRVGSDGTLKQFLDWVHLDEEAVWENETVHWLLSGLPTSAREKWRAAYFAHCERCGDWFFAGRDGARFCRALCRVMSHQQTDEGRATRAQYMRELRAQNQERKLKKAQSSRKRAPQSIATIASNRRKKRKGTA